MKKGKIFKIILSIILLLVSLAGSGLLVYYLYQLTGIENYYRYLTIAFICFLNIVCINGTIYSIRKDKKIRYVFVSLLSLLLGVGLGFLGYFLGSIFAKLDNFNKETYTFSTSIISVDKKYSTLENINNKDIKIGIVNTVEDIEGYVLAKEMYEKEKLSSTLAEYDDADDLMYALYNGRVDAIFVSSDYVDIFSTSDHYSDIEKKAIQISKYEKTYTEDELQALEDTFPKDEEEEVTTTKSMTEPFTILLLGVDSTASKLNKNAAFNGDTIMLITFNPKTMSATMFSVPRDTFVPVTCSGNKYKKVNSAAYGGTSCMINTLENWTGIEIDYYVKINFKGVVDLVDALGGIDVDVPMEFCEQNSKRKWGKYTICLKEGMQHLNGEKALALARHRKTLLLGDFTRGQNQQIVVEGMMNAAKNLRSANDVLEVLDAVSKNIDTNIKTKQILELYDVAKKMIFSSDTNMLNIQKTFLRGYDMYVRQGSSETYSFHNWEGSLKQIVDAMKINLGTKKETAVKELHFNTSTEYERYIAGDRQFSEAKRARLINLVGRTKDSAVSWLTSNGVKKSYITTKTVSCSSSYYKKSKNPGVVTGQTLGKNYLLLNLRSITLYINPDCGQNDPVEPSTPTTPTDPTPPTTPTDPITPPESTDPVEPVVPEE